MNPLRIRLVYKPGVFLWLVDYVDGILQFTTIKANSKEFENRDEAVKVISDLMNRTHWQYNFEIATY